jgi:hypothetical protein
MARSVLIHRGHANGDDSAVGEPEGEQVARWRAAMRPAEAPRSRGLTGDGGTAGTAPWIEGEDANA